MHSHTVAGLISRLASVLREQASSSPRQIFSLLSANDMVPRKQRKTSRIDCKRSDSYRTSLLLSLDGNDNSSTKDEKDN
jgi:hypothetical protein